MAITFDLHTSQQYAREGRIKEWIGNFLTASSNPNLELWQAIKKRNGYWLGPAEVRLDAMKRCCGPEREAKLNSQYIKHPEKDDIWDKRLDDLVQSIARPSETAPILVRYVYQTLGITDGNHRYAAYEKMGLETCWVLIELGTEQHG